MLNTSTLITIADGYKAATGLSLDQTVSHRVFGDSKKLAALRAGAGITVDRFNSALLWFANNWPEGHEMPKSLKGIVAASCRSRGGDAHPVQGKFTGKCEKTSA